MPRTTLVRTGMSPHGRSSDADEGAGGGGRSVGEKSHRGAVGGSGGSLDVDRGGERGKAEAAERLEKGKTCQLGARTSESNLANEGGQTWLRSLICPSTLPLLRC